MNWLWPRKALRHAGPVFALYLIAACSGEPDNMRAWLKERIGHKVQCTILDTESPPFIRIDHVGDDYIIAAPIWAPEQHKDFFDHARGMAIPIASISSCVAAVVPAAP